MSDTANRLTFHLGIPNAQRLRLVGLTLAALIASGHLLFNTRTGVHTVFETFGIGADDTEWAAGPDDPPATVTQTATLTQTLQYPGEILQPSGIAWDASGERLLIVTDQAELFAVSRNLDRVFSETTMSRAPLVARQGSVETVTALGSSAIIAGRDHALPTWEATDDYWRRGEALRGEGYAAPMSGDIMAMAADPESGRLFAADEDGGLWREAQPGSGWEPLVLSGATGGARSLQEYRIMGLEFHAERLYALTEYYPNILVINPASGRIERVFALEGLRDQSGLAMLDGQAFITVDHEYDEASPGLMVFDLEG